MPRTLTPHGVRGSEDDPRSPGGAAPDARSMPYPAAGSVPPPRRSPAEPAAPDTGHPPGPRAARPSDSGAHRLVEPSEPPRAVRPDGPGTGPLPPIATPAVHLDAGPFTVARVGLHLFLAAVPLLAISAQVFGVLEMRSALAWMIVPGVILASGVAMFSPHPVDRILTAGLVWGIVGCVLYDLFRLDTVYVLGWWGDFIPAMGTWVSGGDPGGWDGAVVGYLWRYVGDGGGIGITFFVLAASVGLGLRSRRDTVLAAVAFAVFPVWAGLIGTVALAPRGQQMLFPLTPLTITLSLIGHLIFGVVLGLGYWRARQVEAGWPWPLLPLDRFLPAGLLDARGSRRRPARHALTQPVPRVDGPGRPDDHRASRRSMPSSR